MVRMRVLWLELDSCILDGRLGRERLRWAGVCNFVFYLNFFQERRPTINSKLCNIFNARLLVGIDWQARMWRALELWVLKLPYNFVGVTNFFALLANVLPVLFLVIYVQDPLFSDWMRCPSNSFEIHLKSIGPLEPRKRDIILLNWLVDDIDAVWFWVR